MDHQTFKKSAIRGNDVIVACPYNPSHQILKSRLQTHLVKCARQHKEKEMATCAYNSTHRVPRPELAAHLKECPDRKTLEAHKFTLSDEVASVPRAAVPVPPAAALPACEENWDEEVMDCTYDPSAKVREMKVLRTLTGATKAERKKFRLEERRRVMKLEAAEAAAAAAVTATAAAAAVPLPPSPRGVTSPGAQTNVHYPPLQGSSGGGQTIAPGAGRGGMLRRPYAVPEAITQSLSFGRLGMGRGQHSTERRALELGFRDETAVAEVPEPSAAALPTYGDNNNMWDSDDDRRRSSEWTVAGASKAAQRKYREEGKRRATEQEASGDTGSAASPLQASSPRRGVRRSWRDITRKPLESAFRDETGPDATDAGPDPSATALPTYKDNNNWDSGDDQGRFSEWTVAGASKAAQRKYREAEKRRATEQEASGDTGGADNPFPVGRGRGFWFVERDEASHSIGGGSRRPWRPVPEPRPSHSATRDVTTPTAGSAATHRDAVPSQGNGGGARTDTVEDARTRGAIPKSSSHNLFYSRLGAGRGQRNRQ